MTQVVGRHCLSSTLNKVTIKVNVMEERGEREETMEEMIIPSLVPPEFSTTHSVAYDGVVAHSEADDGVAIRKSCDTQQFLSGCVKERKPKVATEVEEPFAASSMMLEENDRGRRRDIPEVDGYVIGNIKGNRFGLHPSPDPPNLRVVVAVAVIQPPPLKTPE
ncbi:hypothetical protein S245_067245 [Arachis hypogaea]|uniref:Uncharacterized protein n=1 Tax=Arachis hypogaea TaxID=3818 RepID=A0A6B9VC92_ARAHY|nr:uncharacterized protein DS421_19g660310 [Arachis hypogaea]